MKKILLGITLTLALPLAGCNLFEPPAPEEVAVTSISINEESKISYVKVNESFTFTATVLPEDATNKEINWSISGSDFSTISKNGQFVCASFSEMGKTITVTATSKQNPEISDSWEFVIREPIRVTSVKLDKNYVEIEENDNEQLTCSITPTNADNPSVLWSSDNTSVATVDENGQITGIAPGSATITCSSSDVHSLKDECLVIVKKATGEDVVRKTYTITPDEVGSQTNDHYFLDEGNNFAALKSFTKYGLIQINADGWIYAESEIVGLESIVISYASDTEKGKAIVCGSKVPVTSVTDAYDVSVLDNGTRVMFPLEKGIKYFGIYNNASSACLIDSIEYTVIYEPVTPVAVELECNADSISAGKSVQLSTSYYPLNANTDLDVTYSSSNTKTATVTNSGLLTVSETATPGSTFTVTTALVSDPTIKNSKTFTVSEFVGDEWTVMIYICGSDLESEASEATADLEEILSVSGQPDDVNIVVETGGARSWNSKYGIKASELGRWHVQNKRLVKDSSLTNASMGNASTLESFIEYGLKNYPAKNTGFIFWNHGGGLDGCCSDEIYGDSLLNSEINSAFANAFNAVSRSEKMDFVGYDACLMGVQDIAETNSKYFNYMVASQEVESGYGWSYDGWVDQLYSYKDAKTVVKKICTSFIEFYDYAYSYWGEPNDQTLSATDLSKMGAYKAAFEAVAEKIDENLSDIGENTFANDVYDCGKFGNIDGAYYYDVYDIGDFINKLKTLNRYYSRFADEIDALADAFAQLIVIAKYGAGAAGKSGLCMYAPIEVPYYFSYRYSTRETNFTSWRSLWNKLVY